MLSTKIPRMKTSPFILSLVAVLVTAEYALAQQQDASSTAPRPPGTSTPASLGTDSIAREARDAADETARGEPTPAETTRTPTLTDEAAPKLALENQKLEEKNKKQEDEIVQQKEQKEALAKLAEGTFLEKGGLTGGVALAVHVPMGNNDRAELVNLNASAMPYLAVVPAYWRNRPQQNKYCASVWGGGNVNEAIQAAGATVQGQARRKFELLSQHLKAFSAESNEKDALEVAGLIFKGKTNETKEKNQAAERIASDLNRSLKQSDDLETSLKEAFIARIADLYWDATTAGNCWGYKFGLFVGVPARYEAETRIRELPMGNPRGEREAIPRVSFGLAVVPNSWLQVLLGVTYSDIKTGQLDGTDEGQTRAMWTYLVGVGGTIDVVNIFR